MRVNSSQGGTASQCLCNNAIRWRAPPIISETNWVNGIKSRLFLLLSAGRFGRPVCADGPIVTAPKRSDLSRPAPAASPGRPRQHSPETRHRPGQISSDQPVARLSVHDRLITASSDGGESLVGGTLNPIGNGPLRMSLEFHWDKLPLVNYQRPSPRITTQKSDIIVEEWSIRRRSGHLDITPTPAHNLSVPFCTWPKQAKDPCRITLRRKLPRRGRFVTPDRNT